jgi:hypothetical protein
MKNASLSSNNSSENNYITIRIIIFFLAYCSFADISEVTEN